MEDLTLVKRKGRTIMEVGGDGFVLHTESLISEI